MRRVVGNALRATPHTQDASTEPVRRVASRGEMPGNSTQKKERMPAFTIRRWFV